MKSQLVQRHQVSAKFGWDDFVAAVAFLWLGFVVLYIAVGQ
jgi:hypothetical protein